MTRCSGVMLPDERVDEDGRISVVTSGSGVIIPVERVDEDRKKAILQAKSTNADLKLWCDGSKLDKGGTGAAIVWKSHVSQKWQEQKLSLGLNKEIFDAKMWGISEAFKVAEKLMRQVQESWVINIFCDSQSIINNLRECNVGIKRSSENLINE